MANHMSNYCNLLVIVALVLAVGSLVPIAVEGSQVCTDPLDACGPRGQCDQRCKALHNGGKGSCELGLCTCYYFCVPPSPSPSPSQPERKCTQGLGLCNPQCNASCAAKFNQGVGYCNTIANVNLCVCDYVCGSK